MEDIKSDPWFLKNYAGTAMKKRKSLKIEDADVLDSISETEVVFEKQKRHVRLSVRMQNAEPLNAFQFITQIAFKGRINALGAKTKNRAATQNISTNFACNGFPDDVYEKLNTFMKDMKCELKTKETSYLVKARLKGIQDVEFTTHVLPVNNFFVIVEFVKLRGNTLKYHEIFRTIMAKFGLQEQNGGADVDEAIASSSKGRGKKQSRPEVVEMKKNSKPDLNVVVIEPSSNNNKSSKPVVELKRSSKPENNPVSEDLDGKIALLALANKGSSVVNTSPVLMASSQKPLEQNHMKSTEVVDTNLQISVSPEELQNNAISAAVENDVASNNKVVDVSGTSHIN